MVKLYLIAGTTTFSYAFWGLGALLEFGTVWSFALGGVGGLVGFYVGRKASQHFK